VIFHDKGVTIEAILEQTKMLQWNSLQAKANSSFIIFLNGSSILLLV